MCRRIKQPVEKLVPKNRWPNFGRLEHFALSNRPHTTAELFLNQGDHGPAFDARVDVTMWGAF